MNNLLKEFGLKVTKARILVLESLEKSKYPLDIETLYKKIKKSKIDLATLYRTMSSFEEKGIIRRVDLRKDTVLYEMNRGHHHHIVCIKCREIEDFENKELEKVLNIISRKSLKFKNITDHSLEMFGLCRECA